MRFGSVDIGKAMGTILAHSETAGARKIPKGTQLSQMQLDELASHGHETLVVAQLDDGDVHEDAAAERLAKALLHTTDGLVCGTAGHGRVNIRASGAGVVSVDAARINAANLVDPGITVATVPQWQRMDQNGLVATVKIIPYGVRGSDLDRACDLGCAALALRAPVIAQATLIETQVGDVAPSDKGRGAIADRLSRLGAKLSPRVVVRHDAASLARVLAEANGDLVLILTGSATSDIGDVAPEAVRRAGGVVAHYGMPVDPGNLLFIGSLGAKQVIGLPSCARSPALNGADWVLERVVCGVEVTARDIMGMGVGGLLKEIPGRPQPRERSRD